MTLTPQSAGQAVAYVSTTVVALGVLWRYVVRPTWRGWRSLRVRVHVIADVIERELNHNGGSSLKDAVHRVDRNVADLDAQVGGIETRTTENAEAIEAIAQVMDNFVDRKQEDHERLWQAVIDLGGEDPRRK